MYRRLTIILFIPLLVLLSTCEKNPARKELARLNVKYSKSEFFKRVQNSDRAVVELFLVAGMNPDSRGKKGRTALMLAAHEGNIEIVKVLVEHGADVDAKTQRGSTALNSAAAGMVYRKGGEHAAVIRFLIEHGADVNAQPEDGMTALMEAAHAGHADTVQLLVEHGADLNAKGPYNRTALMEAVQYAPDEVVQSLLEHGADPNVEMEGPGGTALTLAEHMNRPQVVKMLKDAGAKK